MISTPNVIYIIHYHTRVFKIVLDPTKKQLQKIFWSLETWSYFEKWFGPRIFCICWFIFGGKCVKEKKKKKLCSGWEDKSPFQVSDMQQKGCNILQLAVVQKCTCKTGFAITMFFFCYGYHVKNLVLLIEIDRRKSLTCTHS